ncbi:hypothetical protein [Labilibaculum sp.]|uniref:hypothetical protein n=1 Tax=Labilibaculum sp. TaxID=2060723 RepID=UPI002AA6D794|nr:hypothetical protein [Labilibaculum sp.]
MNKNRRIEEVHQLLLKEFGTSCNVYIGMDSVWVKKKNSPYELAIIIHYKNSGAPDSNSNNEVREITKHL